MPPKAKADTAGYQKLKKDLSAGTPGQLYLLHGEETYLRDYYLGRLREKVLAGGLEEFNFHPIAAKDMSPHALEEAIDCLPMMAERTLVQVTDFDLFKAGEKDREAYGKLLSQLPDYVCLVFVFDLVPFKMDARTKFSAVIKQAGTGGQLCPPGPGGSGGLGAAAVPGAGQGYRLQAGPGPYFPVR